MRYCSLILRWWDARPTIERHTLATTIAASGSFLTADAMKAYGADHLILSDAQSQNFFLVLFIFAFFGGLARLLLLWRPRAIWQHRLGGVLFGVFGSWVLALYYWADVLEGNLEPTRLMALAGACSAIGGEVIEQTLRYLVTRQIGVEQRKEGE